MSDHRPSGAEAKKKRGVTVKGHLDLQRQCVRDVKEEDGKVEVGILRDPRISFGRGKRHTRHYTFRPQ